MLSLLLPDGTRTGKIVSGTRSRDVSPAVGSSLPGNVLQEKENQLLHFHTFITTNVIGKV
jgi:hypothetical protein